MEVVKKVRDKAQNSKVALEYGEKFNERNIFK